MDGSSKKKVPGVFVKVIYMVVVIVRLIEAQRGLGGQMLCYSQVHVLSASKWRSCITRATGL